MKTVTFICYLLFCAGCFFVSGFSPSAVAADLKRLTSGDLSLPGRVRAAKGKKPALPAALKRAAAAYDAERREGAFARMCFFTAVAFAVLPAVAWLFGFGFLFPVIWAGCLAVPVILSQLSAAAHGRKLADELETALSVISSSYIRCGNLCEAVRANLPGLRRPVSDIFRSFLVNATMLSSDIVLCIRELQQSADNPLFREWCEILVACADDFDNASSLLPVVDRMTEQRLVNSELETMISGCRREYFGMVIITLINIPLLYFINRDWFSALVGTFAGRASLVFAGCAVVVTAVIMMRLTRPIDASRLRGKNAK